MRRVVQQVTAIKEWNNFYTGRQNVVVQLRHFFVNSFQRRLRIGALAQ